MKELETRIGHLALGACASFSEFGLGVNIRYRFPVKLDIYRQKRRCQTLSHGSRSFTEELVGGG